MNEATPGSADRVPPRAATESFYDRNHAGLYELFDALQMERSALGSLADTVALTQQWQIGDHTHPAYQFAVDENVSARLRDLYGNFGMETEVPLVPGHYDYLVGLGGKQPGNDRRLAFMHKTLIRPDIQAGGIALLSGQRPKEPNEKSVIEANLANLAGRPAVDAWAQRMIDDPEGLVWETDLQRLAAADKLGPLTLKQLHLRLENADPIGRYELEWAGTPVTIMHGLAVNRPNGDPRPTTESTMRDWLAVAELRADARVAVIAGNPHIERTSKTARATLAALGRSDIEVVAAGSAAGPDQDHQIYLGEIARNLYEDLRASA